MADPSSVGIMEGAYFVSKRDLLEWLRNDFGMNNVEIKECGNGVVYLKVLDRLYPGRVPLKRVKMSAKQEWECLHNLKILQSVFQDCGIRKHVEIERLSKCNYLDNLEFLQWMKCYYDRFSGEPVAIEDSVGATGCLITSAPLLSRQGVDSSKPSNTRSVTSRPGSSTASNSRQMNGNGKHRLESGSCIRQMDGRLNRQAVSPSRTSRVVRSTSRRDDGMTRKDEEIARLKEELEEYNKELRALQIELENTEKESHFYFGKLRKLEVMSNEADRKGFTVDEVQEILFTEDDLPEATYDIGVEGTLKTQASACQ